MYIDMGTGSIIIQFLIGLAIFLGCIGFLSFIWKDYKKDSARLQIN